jgi:hypothetical protein
MVLTRWRQWLAARFSLLCVRTPSCTTDAHALPAICPAVNVRGTFYALDAATNTPTATECPVDTFGPGLKKQRACLPCPPGYTTNGGVRKTKSSECREFLSC